MNWHQSCWWRSWETLSRTNQNKSFKVYARQGAIWILLFALYSEFDSTIDYSYPVWIWSTRRPYYSNLKAHLPSVDVCIACDICGLHNCHSPAMDSSYQKTVTKLVVIFEKSFFPKIRYFRWITFFEKSLFSVFKHFMHYFHWLKENNKCSGDNICRRIAAESYDLEKARSFFVWMLVCWAFSVKWGHSRSIWTVKGAKWH